MRQFTAISLFAIVLAGLPATVIAQFGISFGRGTGTQAAIHTGRGGYVSDTMALFLESDVDVPPQYPGGSEAIIEHFRADSLCDAGPIDPECRKKMEVLVWFIVERDGSVNDAWIDRGGCEELQARAVCSVLNLQGWDPGVRDVPSRADPDEVTCALHLPMTTSLRSPAPLALVLVLVLACTPSLGWAQLSTREPATTFYQAQPGGIPDSSATWLASDVDVPPEFPGGDAGLTAHFCASSGQATVPVDVSCRKNAEVLIWFIVEQDGSVKEAWIDRGGCPDYQERALSRALSMPQWAPGLRDGRSVRTRVRIPVRYGDR